MERKLKIKCRFRQTKIFNNYHNYCRMAYIRYGLNLNIEETFISIFTASNQQWTIMYYFYIYLFICNISSWGTSKYIGREGS